MTVNLLLSAATRINRCVNGTHIDCVWCHMST